MEDDKNRNYSAKVRSNLQLQHNTQRIRKEGRGSIISQNRVIIKHVKSCTCCFYFNGLSLKVWVGECCGPIHGQLITMPSQDFQIKIMHSKVWTSALDEMLKSLNLLNILAPCYYQLFPKYFLKMVLEVCNTINNSNFSR